MKKIQCPFCDDCYTSLDNLEAHIEDEHMDGIPSDFTISQYMYYLKTGKDHATCVVCKKNNTSWNENTNKYNRICSNPKCKENFRKMFETRMRGKYGKTTLLDDPDQQRKMLAHRKISGEYEWADKTKKSYTGTYELDFLKMLDLFMGWDSEDLITPSPNTYYYMYDGEKKFYIPDMFIPSLNLEIEIKESDNHHPHMIVDRKKEQLKDDVLESQKDRDYIKIVDKNYDNFFKYLADKKDKFMEAKDVVVSKYVKESITQEAIGACTIVKDLVDNVFSHNEIVSLWKTQYTIDENGTKESSRIMVWRGMAHSIPDEYKDKSFNKIFGCFDDEHSDDIRIDLGTCESLSDNFIESLNQSENFIKESADSLKLRKDDDTMIVLNKSYTDIVNTDIKKLKTEVNVMSEASNIDNKLYPVYIILFSNDTDFGKMIRKATGSEYSHAVIALDSTMNNMYSFSDIPFSKASFTGAGFVRESLWSPMYKKNRHFIVMVTFVDKDGLNAIQNKIDYFIDHYTTMKYNDIGLIQYYLNFKNEKNHNEMKKKRWFCSEFVSYMLDVGNIKGFHDILQAPEDIRRNENPNVISLGKFTIPEFKESDLIAKTEVARKEFMKQNTITESYEYVYESINPEILKEGIKDFFKKDRKKYSESILAEYTAIVDWKKLYDQFTSLFTNTNPDVRFDLFELIIRKGLIPAKTSAINVTNNIIDEMTKIYNKVKDKIISAIDIVKGLIVFDKDTISYPDMVPAKESINVLEEDDMDFFLDNDF